MEIETQENTLSTNSVYEINFLGSNIIKDYLKIISTETIDDIKIYAINGQLVKIKYTKNTPNYGMTIDVKHLSKGIYYLSHQKLKSPLKFIKI